MSNRLVFPRPNVHDFLAADEPPLNLDDWRGDTTPMPSPLDSVIAAFDDEDAIDVRDSDNGGV